MTMSVIERQADSRTPFLIQGYGKTYRLTETEFNAAFAAANRLSGDSIVLTTGEAADLLGVSSKTIARLVDAGKIPAFRMSDSGHRLMKKTDVLAYKNMRERRSRHLAEARRLADEMGAYEAGPDPSIHDVSA